MVPSDPTGSSQAAMYRVDEPGYYYIPVSGYYCTYGSSPALNRGTLQKVRLRDLQSLSVSDPPTPTFHESSQQQDIPPNPLIGSGYNSVPNSDPPTLHGSSQQQQDIHPNPLIASGINFMPDSDSSPTLHGSSQQQTIHNPLNPNPPFGSGCDSIPGSGPPLNPNPSFGSDNDSISGSDSPALHGSSQQEVISPPPTRPSPTCPPPLPPTTPAKRRRGQPPGTNKRQRLTPNGKETISETVTLRISSTGELIPSSSTRVTSELYRITVSEGEDIVSKIECFSQQCSKGIYIVSASGSVSTPTFLQPSCELCTHEGKFDILAMSISYPAGTDESFKHGKLSVILVGPKGQMIGGTIVGSFIAATLVQVIVGSCISESEVPKIEQQQHEDENEEEKEEEDYSSYFFSEPPTTSEFLYEI